MKHGCLIPLILILFIASGCAQPQVETPTLPSTADAKPPTEEAPPIPTPAPASSATRLERATQTHQDAVEMVLTKAKTDNYYKYGIYAARILAVKHPEIYLQADDLFLQTIETNTGFKKAYEIDDVGSDYFIWYFIGGEMSGPPFSFDYVDFTKYQIIKSKELYPEGYPVLPYLDRRFLPLASTLKSVSNRLTQLGKVEQCYFALKEKGTAPDHLYLVYCDSGNAYLYDQGNLIEAKDLEKVGQVEGNPILVFNEKSAWYPLMGRDDTPKDATLKQIVDKYATNIVVPKLSDFETRMVQRLLEVTSLEGLQEYGAIVVAARAHDIPRVENRPFSPIWDKFARIDNWVRASLKREVLKDANYLSPIAAYLAAISEEYTGEAKIEGTCQEYVEHATAPGGRWPGGCLWMAGLVEYTIDESYYAHIGDDAVQAANTQAWLDIAGIDSYWLQGAMFAPRSSRHFHVYIPEYDVRVSNGSFDKAPEVYHKSVLPYNPRLSGETLLEGVAFLGHNSKWAALQPVQQYSGTLSPVEAIQILEHLKSMHSDDIKGIKGDEANRGLIPFNKLIEVLKAKQNSWKSLELP